MCVCDSVIASCAADDVFTFVLFCFFSFDLFFGEGEMAGDRPEQLLYVIKTVNFKKITKTKVKYAAIQAKG